MLVSIVLDGLSQILFLILLQLLEVFQYQFFEFMQSALVCIFELKIFLDLLPENASVIEILQLL